MASAASRMDAFALLAPVFIPATVGAVGYAAYKVNWVNTMKAFLTGPGRTSRILLLLFVFFNWKNMPFAWTVRPPTTRMLSHSLADHPSLVPCLL